MIYAFQDRENLYLIMDLMTGGDLRYHLALKRTFTEEQTSMREMKLNNDDFRVFCSMHIYRIGIFAHK